MTEQIQTKDKKGEFKELTKQEKNEIIKINSDLVNPIIHYYGLGLKYFKDDLRQEGWLYVFKHWKNFDPLKSQRSTWIYNTFKLGCRNAVRKEYYKQSNKAGNLSEEIMDNGGMNTKRDPDTEENLIKQLPDPYREIVYDRVVRKLGVHEIRKKYKLQPAQWKKILKEVEEILLQR